MRVRRRLGFAAPVVAVFACRTGAPMPPDPDEDTRRHRVTYLPSPKPVAVAADPSEVAPSPPPDADEVRRTTVIDAITGGEWPPAARPKRVQPPPAPNDVCLDPGEAYRVYRVHCNPPPRPVDVCADPVAAARLYGVRCNPPPPNPPPPTIARVVSVQLQGNDTVVTVAAGSEDGVDRGDRGVILDANDRPLRGSDFTIVKVIKRASVGKVKLTPGQLPANPRARITHTP